MKIILISLAIVATLFGITAVHARYHDTDEMVEKITKKLTLDANQQSALRILIEEKKKLRSERKARHQARKAEYKAARKNGEKIPQGPFAELASQDSISLDDMNRLIDERQLKQRELRQPALQAFVDFRNSLSVEQREEAQPIFHKILRGIVVRHSKKHSRHAHSL